jgi:rRNA maturation endonuclease Nob1
MINFEKRKIIDYETDCLTCETHYTVDFCVRQGHQLHLFWEHHEPDDR